MGSAKLKGTQSRTTTGDEVDGEWCSPFFSSICISAILGQYPTKMLQKVLEWARFWFVVSFLKIGAGMSILSFAGVLDDRLTRVDHTVL